MGRRSDHLAEPGDRVPVLGKDPNARDAFGMARKLDPGMGRITPSSAPARGRSTRAAPREVCHIITRMILAGRRRTRCSPARGSPRAGTR